MQAAPQRTYFQPNEVQNGEGGGEIDEVQIFQFGFLTFGRSRSRSSVDLANKDKKNPVEVCSSLPTPLSCPNQHQQYYSSNRPSLPPKPTRSQVLL